jgi:uncharacterized protein YdhG (YjbR/CyaY superfamily)
MAAMKKTKSSKRTATAKFPSASKKSKAPTTIDEYLAGVSEPARTTLNKVRATIRSVVPAQTVEGISYGMPVFKYKGSLIWFAAFVDHCSIFPTAAAIAAFKNELNDYATSKGTIQFPVNKPLPPALLKKLVKFRVAQVESAKR